MRRYKLRYGLEQIRDLVNGTHWIKGSYISVHYLDGDGEYEDGAVVRDSKVVGCLVGLSRMVAAKTPTYYKGRVVQRDNDIPVQNEFALAMEDAIANTIQAEFLDGYLDEDEDDPNDLSIEGWNDSNVRTKEDVIAMLDRAIERVGRERPR